MQPLASSSIILAVIAAACNVVVLARHPFSVKDHDVFTGSYICLQGSTGLALHIDKWPAGRFKFFPTPLSPHNCSGEYRVRGMFWWDVSRTLAFEPVREDPWIHNDCGYDTVGISGHLADNGMRFSGVVDAGYAVSTDCTTFSLVKGGGSSHACFDSDNGAVDKHGEACRQYRGKPHRCGTRDDADFRASRLCCACGGGLRGGLTTSACFDWKVSRVDREGANCTWYDWHPEECGLHDTPGFFAADVCCQCGGGVQAIGTGLRQELKDLQDARAERAALLRSTEKLRLRMEKLRLVADTVNDTAESEVEVLQQENQYLKLRSDTLKLRSATARSERQRLEENLTWAQVEADAMRASHDAVEAKLEELSSSYDRLRLFAKLAALLLGLALVVAVARCASGGRAWRFDDEHDAREVEVGFDSRSLSEVGPCNDCAITGESGDAEEASKHLL